jgi:hypothetical protein
MSDYCLVIARGMTETDAERAAALSPLHPALLSEVAS